MNMESSEWEGWQGVGLLLQKIFFEPLGILFQHIFQQYGYIIGIVVVVYVLFTLLVSSTEKPLTEEQLKAMRKEEERIKQEERELERTPEGRRKLEQRRKEARELERWTSSSDDSSSSESVSISSFSAYSDSEERKEKEAREWSGDGV